MRRSPWRRIRISIVWAMRSPSCPHISKPRPHATRGLYVYQDDDGTVVVRGRLTPEAGALFRRALDAAREALYQRTRAAAVPVAAANVSAQPSVQNVSAETPTMPQQQTDALVLLA